MGSLGGGLAGGLGAARIGRVAPQTEELLQTALRDIPPEAMQKAQALQKMALAKGINMDIAQALEGVGLPSNDLTTLRNVLAQSTAGRNVQKTLQNQPGELESATHGQIDSMPGKIFGEEQAANILGEGATNTIDSLNKGATNVWGQTFDTGIAARKTAAMPAVKAGAAAATAAEVKRQKLQTDLADLQARVKAMREGGPDFVQNAPVPEQADRQAAIDAAKGVEATAKADLTATVRGIKEVPANVVLDQRARLLARAKGMENTPLGDHLTDLANSFLKADGTPITDAKNLNDILKAAVSKTKTINLRTPGTDRGVTKAIEGTVIDQRDALGAAFEPIQQANAAFKQHMADVVEPVKQGRVGSVAAGGYDAAKQIPVSRLQTMFGGVDPNTPKAASPIRTAAKSMGAAGEGEAFQDAAKTYWSAKLGDAFEANPQGGPATNIDAAKKMSKFLLQSRTFQAAQDTVASVAELSGTSAPDAVRGLKNYASIVKALANSPDKIGGLRSKEVFQMGGQNYGSDALRIFGFLPFNTAARRLEDRVLQNTFRDLDNLMTTPEGAAKLAELGRVPVMSQKAIMLFATLGATAATVPAPGQ